MSDDFVTGIRIDPGFDNRDEPGGRVSPLSVIFVLVGPRARVSWGINTGWVQRPVLTERLRRGVQERDSRPGVDPFAAVGFPEPRIVSIVNTSTGDAEIHEAADGYEWHLMDALFDGGTPAVLSILRAIYDIHTA